MDKFLRWDNPVILFFEQVFNLMIVNFLFLICSVPVFTIGASLTAMCKVAQDIVLGSETQHGIIRRFFETFRLNFKQATLAWLIVLFFLCGLGYNVFLIAANHTGTGMKVIVGLLVVLMLIVVGLASYVFPLIARYEDTLKVQYRNAMILFVMRLPRTLMMIVLNTMLGWLALLSLRVFMSVLILWVIVGFAAVCYMDTTILKPVFALLEADARKAMEADNSEE